jgi:hypothetical protein
LPDRPGEIFGCAEGEVGEVEKQDASLPFLSSTAGLLLAAELIRLQSGSLMDSPANFHGVFMGTPSPRTQEARFVCSEGCRYWMRVDRRLARTAESRFAYLDGDR